MSRCLTACLLLCLAAGCGRSTSQKPAPSGPQRSPADPAAIGELRVGQPIRYANLTVFPITSRVAKDERRFVTLDEGLRAGTVEVFEIGVDGAALPGLENPETPLDPPVNSLDDVPPNPGAPDNANPPPAAPENAPRQAVADGVPTGDPLDIDMQTMGIYRHGADVNQVMVINRSDKPLYLMPGEIIMGGQQDRCVGEEFVIQPGDEPVPVAVFCVEHGRWGGRAPVDTAAFVANAAASEVVAQSVSLSGAIDVDMAVDANQGKFIASVGSLNRKARLAVQESQDQGLVWDSVAMENAKGGVELATGAFTGNYVDEQAVARLEPYLAALQDKVAGVERVVGVAVAVNGEIQSMDVFESTPLFQGLWPKLLKSYALDAANAADGDDAEQICAHAQACDFVREAMQGQVEQSDVKRGLAVTRRSSGNVVSFSAQDAAAAEPGMAGLGGGGVHTSAFSR